VILGDSRIPAERIITIPVPKCTLIPTRTFRYTLGTLKFDLITDSDPLDLVHSRSLLERILSFQRPRNGDSG